MALFETIDSTGADVSINTDEIIGITRAPASIVPASAFVDMEDGTRFVLPGTVASVTAAIGGGATTTVHVQSPITGDGTLAHPLGFSPSSAVSFNGKRATDLANPTGAQDAATKAYVDAAGGLSGTYAPAFTNIKSHNGLASDGTVVAVGNFHFLRIGNELFGMGLVTLATAGLTDIGTFELSVPPTLGIGATAVGSIVPASQTNAFDPTGVASGTIEKATFTTMIAGITGGDALLALGTTNVFTVSFVCTLV